jgi:CPA2 family monovalent cation:H+ antiporter-2
VLFFVSVGMLFDPGVVLREPLALAASLLVVTVGGPAAAYLGVRALGYPRATALLIAIGLAQIGEFSFILANLGIDLGILPPIARDLILGTSILTILANPLLFAAVERWRARGEKTETAASPQPIRETIPTTTLEGHAVLVGYGRVGGLVGASLRDAGWPLLVIEDAEAPVDKLRADGVDTIRGNAADPAVLAAANLAHARVLLVAIPNAFEAIEIVKAARAANPGLDIVARAHFDAEVEELTASGAAPAPSSWASARSPAP